MTTMFLWRCLGGDWIDNPEPGSIYETINKVMLKTCGIKEAIKTIAEDPIWRERDTMPKRDGSIVSNPPAVVSAVHDATGVWFKELPITPEKIVRAVKEKGEYRNFTENS